LTFDHPYSGPSANGEQLIWFNQKLFYFYPKNKNIWEFDFSLLELRNPTSRLKIRKTNIETRQRG